MLSEKLKEFTKTAHQLLEKKLITNIKAIHTQQDYAALLSLFYSFFGGMEVGIDEHIDTTLLPDYTQRRKAAALAEDLEDLKATLPEKASEKDTPSISSHLQAMGALYVMEGSTLGGKIISQMIQKKLNLPDGFALSFFNSYGENTGSMWQTFKDAINQPLSAPQEAIVIQSADDTFIRFREWFEQPLSERYF